MVIYPYHIYMWQNIYDYAEFLRIRRLPPITRGYLFNKHTFWAKLVDTIDLQALYLSGTYCHKTGTRPPSCQAPRQTTINVTEGKTIYKKTLKLVLIMKEGGREGKLSLWNCFVNSKIITVLLKTGQPSDNQHCHHCFANWTSQLSSNHHLWSRTGQRNCPKGHLHIL